MISPRPAPSARRLFTRLAYRLQRVREALWKITGRPVGIHALPITPSGMLILVRLTYAPGWRLPGGGKKARETPEEGVLRELREEIGLQSFDRLARLGGAGEDPALGQLFVVEGVRYRPKRSWEIEAVQEFDPRALPPGTTARTARWVGQFLADRDAARS